MPCPFYGHHASELMRTILSSGGNQCALITGAYAPCKMETAGAEPDLERCEFNGSGRAIEFAKFERATLAYPD